MHVPMVVTGGLHYDLAVDVVPRLVLHFVSKSVADGTHGRQRPHDNEHRAAEAAGPKSERRRQRSASAPTFLSCHCHAPGLHFK